MFGRSRTRTGLIVVAVVLITAGCEVLSPTVCTTEAVPALNVEVLDSLSLEPVPGDMRVIARVGALADTVNTEEMTVPPSADRDTVVFGPFSLAFERAGTYDVTVEAPDYTPWQRSGVQVDEGECHVHTVELTARLQPVNH